MPRKKSKVKAKPRVKRGGKLAGPSFDGWENWTGEAFVKFRNNAHAFYYENYKPADLLSSVWNWMKSNGYTKEQITIEASIKTRTDLLISPSVFKANFRLT